MSEQNEVPLLTADQATELINSASRPYAELEAIETGAAVVIPADKLEALERDAARYRWLRDQTCDDGCVIVMKEKHIPRFTNYARAIDDYIDSAIAKEQGQ